jgi:hypothetical protein
MEASWLLFYRDRVCSVQVVNLSTPVSLNDLDLKTYFNEFVNITVSNTAHKYK